MNKHEYMKALSKDLDEENIYARQIWNEAIDRAAKCVGYKDQALANIVRELKK